MIGTDCIGCCKSNYHTITTTFPSLSQCLGSVVESTIKLTATIYIGILLKVAVNTTTLTSNPTFVLDKNSLAYHFMFKSRKICNLRDTLNAKQSGNSFIIRVSSVLLPPPEGPLMTIGRSDVISMVEYLQFCTETEVKKNVYQCMKIPIFYSWRKLKKTWESVMLIGTSPRESVISLLLLIVVLKYISFHLFYDLF